MADTPKPVNIRSKLFSQICDDAERDNLNPGEVKPRETYPVYNFSGRQFHEDLKTGKVKGRP